MFFIKLIMLLIISFVALPVAFVIFWVTTVREKKSLEKKLQMLQQNLNMLYETGQISFEAYQNILRNCELSEGYYVAPENGRQPEDYHAVTENISQPKDYHAITENGRTWEECHIPSENNKPLEGYQMVPPNGRSLEESQSVQEPYVTFSDSPFTPSMDQKNCNQSVMYGEPSEAFTQPAMENKKTGAVIGFSLGVLFIFLAGILFSVTNWQNWSAFEKIGIVFGAGVVCYGLSGIAKKVLSLTLTCEAFYTLGSILAMLGVYAMGFYGMFGEYLSPGGNGAALYFLCICLLELCFTLGYDLFRDTLYKILCAAGLTLSVIWGGIAFCPSMGEMVLLLCIFSTVVLGICLRYYRECRFLQHYSLFNLCISGISVFLYYVIEQGTSSYNCLIQAAGLLLLAVSFLFLNISKTYSDLEHVTSTVSVSLLVSSFLTILWENTSGVLPFMCLFTFLSFALIFVYGVHLYSHEQENAPKAWLSMTTGYGVLGILCQGISILLIVYQQFEKEKVTLECMIFSGIAVLIYFGFYAFLKKVHLTETKNVFGYFRLSEHSVYGTFLLLFFYTMVLFYFGVTLGKASYCISTCIGLGVISLLFVPAIRKGGFWGFVACHGGNIYLLLLFLMVYAQTKISGWYFLVLWVCTAFYGYWNVQFGKKCYAVLEQVNLVIFVLVFLADYDILKDNYAVVLSLLTVLVLTVGYFLPSPLKQHWRENNWVGRSSILWILFVFWNEGKYGPFVGMLLLALYSISYCKGKEDKRLPVLQNIAAFFVAFACSIQPFFEYPDCISFELYLLPFFVYWIQYPYAFKKNEESCNTRDIMIHILFGMLSMHALVADTAVSAIILGVAGCLVFFVASYLKNKRYIRMSAILLVLLGIYASRDFLHSLGWWFYLLIAGIGFFLYAIIREKKR